MWGRLFAMQESVHFGRMRLGSSPSKRHTSDGLNPGSLGREAGVSFGSARGARRPPRQQWNFGAFGTSEL